MPSLRNIFDAGRARSPRRRDNPLLRHHQDRFAVVERLTKQAGGDTGALNGGIFIVRDTHTKKLCVKKVFAERDNKDGHAKREIAALKQLRGHRHISNLVAVDSSPAGIVMDNYELGALDTLIDKYEKKGRFLPEGFLWRVLIDMSKAICYCVYGIDSKDSRGEFHPVEGWSAIVHRDIKPGNIFLTMVDQQPGSSYPRVVLGDFGCSVGMNEIVSHTVKSSTSRQARAFAPPEAPNYDRRSDTFQVGLVMHCLSRLLMIPEWQLIDIGASIKSLYSEGLEEVVEKYFLRKTPSHRASASQLLSKADEGAQEYLRSLPGRKAEPLALWSFE